MKQLVASASHDLHESVQTIWNLHAVLAQALINSSHAPQIALLEEALRNMDQVIFSLVDVTRAGTDAAAARVQVSGLTSALSAHTGVKVLHIEDDPSVARSMARLLRLHGYEVASAATRDEAMHHLGVHGLRPDLILTDSNLRGEPTGNQVVADLVARLEYKPPTIMLTSVTARQPENAGSLADRILSKPVDINVLVGEMESLLGVRRTRARGPQYSEPRAPAVSR